MTPVQIDKRTEVRVKDNVSMGDGWHLWCAIYVDGEFVTGDAGPIVADLDHDTIVQAARGWYAERFQAGSAHDSRTRRKNDQQ